MVLGASRMAWVHLMLHSITCLQAICLLGSSHIIKSASVGSQKLQQVPYGDLAGLIGGKGRAELQRRQGFVELRLEPEEAGVLLILHKLSTFTQQRARHALSVC